MTMKRVLFVSLVAALAAIQTGLMAEPPARLTDQHYAAVRKHVALRAGDLRFQQIDWHARVLDGVIRAQKEDRPLLVWFYFGDPRGNC